MRKPQYSPSRLHVYQTCPRQYHYQYVRKLPRRAWANQSFGTSLHRTLQVLHEQGGPAARPLEEAQAQLERSWTGAGYDSHEHEVAELARGKDLLAAYYRTWSETQSIPLLLEKRLSAPYQGITLLGIVDRVDRRFDGSLEIIDYKSGHAPAEIRPHTLQQLGIYHYLIGEKLRETVQHHTVHYLASNVRLSLSLGAAHIEEILEGVRKTVERLEADQRFIPRVAGHCLHCDYLRYCDAGRDFAAQAAEQP
ncbi:MAG TPA: PD-(D/E)XK nuclease family protein [Pantanalinema sp.]